MTPQQFKEFWLSTYPRTLPIPHLFKYGYSDRWFRIHSLPQSQRYADTIQEWDILLTRHNTIITDLLGDNVKVLLVTGDYNYNKPTEEHITQQEPIFLNFRFQHIDAIDLHDLNSKEYYEGEIYRPAFTDTVWKPHQYDHLLKEIANDQLRVFFLSLEKEVIVAPYDGGIDFILKDEKTRDFYKNKYKDWLSAREDGM